MLQRTFAGLIESILSHALNAFLEWGSPQRCGHEDDPKNHTALDSEWNYLTLKPTKRLGIFGDPLPDSLPVWDGAYLCPKPDWHETASASYLNYSRIAGLLLNTNEFGTDNTTPHRNRKWTLPGFEMDLAVAAFTRPKMIPTSEIREDICIDDMSGKTNIEASIKGRHQWEMCTLAGTLAIVRALTSPAIGGQQHVFDYDVARFCTSMGVLWLGEEFYLGLCIPGSTQHDGIRAHMFAIIYAGVAWNETDMETSQRSAGERESSCAC